MMGEERQDPKREAYLNALDKLLQVTARVDRSDVLKPILEAVRPNAPVDAVGIYLLSDDKQTVERFSLISHHTEVIPGRGQRLPVIESDLALVALEGQSRIFDDLLTIPDKPRKDREIAIEAGVRSAAAVPIKNLEGRSGTVVFDSYAPHAFDEHDLRFFEQVVKLIGVHLRNRHVLKQALQTERLKAVLEERHQLARQRKDGELQALVSIAERTEALLEVPLVDEASQRSLRQLQEKVDDLLGAMRGSVAALDTGYPVGLSLEEALSEGVESLEARTEIATRWSSYGSVDDLSTSARLALHRAAERQLAMIERERTAGWVSVRLERRDSDVVLEIEDDGHVEGTRGLESGPTCMVDYRLTRSEMEKLDGEVDVRRVPGWGTRVTWRLPARHLGGGPGAAGGSIERPIRVMVVHSHPLTRQSLAHLIDDEPDIDVVGEAADWSDARQITERSSPDVALIGTAGLRLGPAESILEQHPDIAAILLDCESLSWNVRRAFALGARGYLSRGADAERLLNTVRRVARGRSVLDPELTERFVDGMQDGTIESLTDREHEVLALVAEGMSNQEIGEELVVAESTVSWHVHNVLQKLGAKNRTDAVRIGRERGLMGDVGPGR